MTLKILFVLIIALFCTSLKCNDDWNMFDDILTKLRGCEQPGEKWPPEFCRNYRCPRFTVINTTETYQIREYAPSTWVSTSSTGVPYRKAKRAMYRKLYSYKNMNNKRNQKIKRTVPVLVEYSVENDLTNQNNFTMSFYMAIDDPPAPRDPTVKITHKGVERKYVRCFPGYILTKQRWMREVEKLRKDINNASLYDTSRWYSAGYNSPLHLFRRNNEVSVRAK